MRLLIALLMHYDRDLTNQKLSEEGKKLSQGQKREMTNLLSRTSRALDTHLRLFVRVPFRS
eukprot:10596656-Prorocentrum_lima.AAC.1